MNLDRLLEPAQRAAGLHLEEDEDWVRLCGKDGRSQLFGTGTELKEILETADRFVLEGEKECNAQFVKLTW